MTVTIYCDTTGLFSESEMNRNNLCEMEFDGEVVEEWFEEKISAEVPYGFEVWFLEEYTADDTDGLYQFSVAKGKKPTFGIDDWDWVFYRDDCNYKYIVFEGTYDECREFGRDNEWTWHDEELEMWLL